MNGSVDTLISQVRVEATSLAPQHVESEVVVPSCPNNTPRTPPWHVSSYKMKKYSSTNDLLSATKDNEVGVLPLLRRTILNDIMLLLPPMIQDIVHNQYTMLSTPGNQTPPHLADNETLNEIQKEIKDFKSFKSSTTHKLEGYTKQVEVWKTAVKECRSTVAELMKKSEDQTKMLEKQEFRKRSIGVESRVF